jgi:Putative beta-barrel porin-2, OmpL-like. bbp2
LPLGAAGLDQTKPKTKKRYAMKSRITLVGALLAAMSTAAQAEVKINENLSFDGYAIGSGVVTEGTEDKNGPHFGKSGGAYDALYIALNGTYKDFTSKVSIYSFNPLDGDQVNSDGDPVDHVGILDAYVTYKTGNLSLTGGKYLGWLGFESFHSPNNAFISFSKAKYESPFSTGVKADYAGEGFSTGISIRDSQIAYPALTEGFFEGDGEFADDLGFEAYVMLTSIKDLTVFFGAGYEDVDGGDQITTLDLWANYKISEKFSLAGEIATLEDTTDFSWLLQGTYAATEALSVSGRVTGFDGQDGAADSIGYGIASTYTISANFSVKGEVTLSDSNAGDPDTVSYAIQGLFRF